MVVYLGTPGRVCNDNWTDNDAKVICSMLGYQRLGSTASAVGTFSRGSEGNWLDVVNCHGNEISIAQCPTFNGWTETGCTGSQDAGVICSTGSRLDNFLIVTDSRHRRIYRMDLSTFSYTTIPHDSHSTPIAVGYDHVDQQLYWSDVNADNIKKSNLDGSNPSIVLSLPFTPHPDGLAVDTISRNLYFTDTGTNTITVSRLDGSVYKRIVTSGLDEPRGIAVHPGIGYMFWTDWSTIHPRIEKSRMDGSGRTIIVTSNLRWPNDIAIDYSANLLYWLDGFRDDIEKADFNGENRVTIYRESGQVFGLTLIQDYIYYTDWRESNIIRIHKNGRDREAVGPSVFGRLNGLFAYKSGEGIETLATNGCTIGRGNCRHICVPMPNNAITCLCPDGMACETGPPIPNPRFVRLVGGSTANQGRVEVYYQNTFWTVCRDNWGVNNAKVICSMLGYQRAGSRVSFTFPRGSGKIWLAINCHGNEIHIGQCPTSTGWGVNACTHSQDAGVICSAGTRLDNFLIVADSRNHHIYRMDLSTFSYTTIQHGNNNNTPVAVGYDHIERKLYWSDVVANFIKKSNLDGTGASVIIRLPNNAVPDGLAVDPISRNLYFTDTGADTITVSRLDGSVYMSIITSGLDEPRGIAVHPGIGYMFWTDWSSTNPRIEKSMMDGSGRTTIATSNLRWPNGIAIDYSANLLYWVDGSRDIIQKADFNGNNRETIFSESGHFFGLAVIQDYIYCTDWRESNIIRIHKAWRNRTLVGPSVGRLNGLLAYKSGEGIELLNAPNACTIGRGSCSHICVPMPSNTIKCLCPDNMTLDVNGKTCQPVCGLRPIVQTRARVIGGFKAVAGAFPWQAGIRKVNTHGGMVTSAHHCGATIVSDFWIISAAHCFTDLDKSHYIIRVGDLNNEQEDAMEKTFKIQHLILHELFDSVTIDYDIALINVKPNADGSGIIMNTHIQPACLPNATTLYRHRQPCLVSGWGQIYSYAYPNELHAAAVPLIDQTTCERSLYKSKLSRRMICAGFMAGGIDTCTGDSGGPIVCNVNGKYMLLGVTSWGFECARANAPGVYAKVQEFLPWLQKQIDKYS